MGPQRSARDSRQGILVGQPTPPRDPASSSASAVARGRQSGQVGSTPMRTKAGGLEDSFQGRPSRAESRPIPAALQGPPRRVASVISPILPPMMPPRLRASCSSATTISAELSTRSSPSRVFKRCHLKHAERRGARADAERVEACMAEPQFEHQVVVTSPMLDWPQTGKVQTPPGGPPARAPRDGPIDVFRTDAVKVGTERDLRCESDNSSEPRLVGSRQRSSVDGSAGAAGRRVRRAKEPCHLGAIP